MNILNNPSSADEALHKTLVKEYMEVAKEFYYEGSSEGEEREEYAPKWADKMLPLIKQYGLEQRIDELKNLYCQDWQVLMSQKELSERIEQLKATKETKQ